MKHKLYFLFSLLVIAVMVLSACGTEKPASQPEKVTVEDITSDPMWSSFSNAYVQQDTLRNTAIKYEVSMTDYYNNHVMEDYNAYLVSAGEQSRAVKSCFTMTEDFVTAAADAVFATTDGAPTSPGEEANAIVQQLAINVDALSVDSLYAGDPAECQKELSDFIAWARVERKAYVNDRKILGDMMAGYEAWKLENYSTTVQNTFATQYGPYVTRVIEQLGAEGTKLINGLAQKVGVDAQALPLTQNQLGFLGLPTDALHATTNSESLCNKYYAVYTGDANDPEIKKYTGGLPTELYHTQFLVSGGCQVFRQAAWDLMSHKMFSAETTVRQGCGVDAGFDQEIDPETCEPIEGPLP